MTQHEFDLIHGYLDGTIGETDFTHLQSLLRDNAEARQMLRSLSTVDAKWQELAAANPETLRLLATPAASQRGPGRNPAWFSWRPLTAAAAGIVLGIFCTSVVFAYASPRFAGAKPVKRQIRGDSFEAGVNGTMPGLRTVRGVWSGDEARVVTAEQGVTPKIGEKMLRFVSATYPGENTKFSVWGDVYRLVDLRGQVRDGNSVLRLSASFAAAAKSDNEKYECSLEMSVIEKEMTDLPQPHSLISVSANSMAVVTRRFPMTRDSRWQDVSAEVPVSPRARYVLLHLAVLRVEPPASAEPVRFSGHYLDAVKLELISEPPLP